MPGQVVSPEILAFMRALDVKEIHGSRRLMTEIVGFKELTPHKGGWAGNRIFADSFTPKLRKQARDLTFKFGEQPCKGAIAATSSWTS